jgi:hypothetical protein
MEAKTKDQDARVIPCNLTTAEFAALNGIKPNTVRQHLCNKGSYYGVKCQKRANGRTYWPAICPTLDA